MKKYILITFAVLGSFLCAYSYVPKTLSPRNWSRPILTEVEQVVLHTTEGDDISGYTKVRHDGSCHFLIRTTGKIDTIILPNRKAWHAGLSMWNGKHWLNTHALGIEVVGYHNKPITFAQKIALQLLITTLKAQYGLIDEDFVTHSMISYLGPNAEFSYPHRYRLCGMQFATRELRQQIGLMNVFDCDSDVLCGRIVPDEYLDSVLYRSHTDDEDTVDTLVKLVLSQKAFAHSIAYVDDVFCFVLAAITHKNIPVENTCGYTLQDSYINLFYLRVARTKKSFSDQHEKLVCSAVFASKVSSIEHVYAFVTDA